jgi:hypothetical protein
MTTLLAVQGVSVLRYTTTALEVMETYLTVVGIPCQWGDEVFRQRYPV